MTKFRFPRNAGDPTEARHLTVPDGERPSLYAAPSPSPVSGR